MRIEVPVAAVHEPGHRGLETNGVTGEPEEISLIDLAIALAERKRLIFSIALAFTLLSAIVSLLGRRSSIPLRQRFSRRSRIRRWDQFSLHNWETWAE